MDSIQTRKPRTTFLIGAVAAALALPIGSAIVTAPPASAATQPGTVSPAPSAVPVGGRLARVVTAAKRGVAARPYYSSGGGHGARPAAVTSPTDCSGFARAAYWEGFGIDIGAGSGHSIVYSGRFHQVSNPVPGDIVSFSSYGAVFHLSVYAGVVNGARAGYAQVSSGTPARLQHWNSPWYAGVQVRYWRLNAATAADLQAIQRTALSARSSTAGAEPGQRVKLSGRLTANGQSGGATRVALYSRTSVTKPWVYRGAAATNRAGSWTKYVTAGSKAEQWQARYRSPNPARKASKSAGVLVKLRAPVRFESATASLRSLSTGTVVRASVSKAYAGARFVVQRHTTKGWRTVEAGRVQPTGAMTVSLNLTRGSYGFRIAIGRPQASWTATTFSPVKRIVVS